MSLSLFVWLIYVVATKAGNEFDTYNEECPRIRRPWNSLSESDRQTYISAVLQLRKNGGGKIDTDEFVSIASVHEDDFGSIAHMASSYLFWHGYLLWELESRIRALGDEYKCFAVPYWDFSSEADRTEDEQPYIFSEGLGGYGNPDDYWTVNGYSWNIPTSEWWVPADCTAKDDSYPICSLKRATSDSKPLDAAATGEGIISNPIFSDFSRWYSSTFNLPHALLTNDDSLIDPVITSYDPIWYLFHSMVSYHQAIWTDCNDYDLINPNDLHKYTNAYEPFCDAEPKNKGCGGMELDDSMYFGGNLKGKEWSFIHNNDLTVRKSYHLDRWNVMYDLNGDDFYVKSGLDEYCKGKLNKDWFILGEGKENDNRMLDSTSLNGIGVGMSVSEQILIGIFVVIWIGFLWYWCRGDESKIKMEGILRTRVLNDYGSV